MQSSGADLDLAQLTTRLVALNREREPRKLDPSSALAEFNLAMTLHRLTGRNGCPLLDSSNRKLIVGEVRPVVTLAERYLLARALGSQLRFEDLLGHSLLGMRPRAGELSRPDYYDLTHWIFYLTDYCRSPLPELPPASLRWLSDTVRLGIDVADDDDDSDLLAELLACAISLDCLPYPVSEQYWGRLLDQAVSESFLRPAYSQELADSLPVDLSLRYRFRHHYHTYVATSITAIARTFTAKAPPARNRESLI